jgi:hypothetical protein
MDYASLADDYYVNLALTTEMELSGSRDTVLHFAEQIQKRYPDLRNFYARDKHDFVLEGDKDQGSYRWCSIEPRRVSSGFVNPPDYAKALEQHRFTVDVAPYALSVSPLDCEMFDLLVGFDFSYRGNHNQLIAEALGACHGFERLTQVPGTSFINYEPSISLALDEECRTQVRVHVETRTSPFHIRSGEYPEDQVSVYVTARRYGSLDPGTTFPMVLDRLDEICREFIDSYVAANVLEPLARTIAMK